MTRSTRLPVLVLHAIAACAVAADSTAAEAQQAQPAPAQAQEGVVHVPAFDLPLSGYLSAETRAVLQRRTAEFAQMRKECPLNLATASDQEVIAKRRCVEKHYFPALIGRYRARYKVNIEPRTIGGVATEIITPAEGVSSANRQRVLISLHSGGFIGGGRWGGQVDSIPIAAIGKFRIVAVDYRLAPEYRFPAASEDVAAVYKALLKDYKPQNIGIYGCSSGGILTAESIAWFQKEGLPAPGAIGMFCAGAYMSEEGDSDNLDVVFSGSPPTRSPPVGSPAAGSPPPQPSRTYFSDADLRNPLAVPGLDAKVMAGFPASLLITATRDGAMSSVIVTHARLTSLGVKAELHVWEGLGHAFYFEPDYPESREVYDVVARFFAAHLGGAPVE